jgi:formylglycine-generating enzyme
MISVGDYSIGKTEITQSQWKAVMGNNPSNFKGDNLPVTNFELGDAFEYCNKLSQLEGLQKCYSGTGSSITCNFEANGYRLPTEAEWVFAEKGGNKSLGYKYAGSNNIDEVAWHNENSGNKTHPVMSKKPNELGIYDMNGNVWEWCWDIYDVGVSKGRRALRGGSWLGFYDEDAWKYNIPYGRASGNPSAYRPYGFRVARTK